MVKAQLFHKSPVGAYLRLNEWIWNRLPPALSNCRPIQSYGRFLHALVCLQVPRHQYFGTFFLRNRPALELIRSLANRHDRGAPLKISVLGCSNGAEVYSILWTIHSARPDLKVEMSALDISDEILAFAQKGIYSPTSPDLLGEPILQRMTDAEIGEMFEREGVTLKIKSGIKECIRWHVADARDPDILNVLGPQDIVLANNFLCHMYPVEAETCLRNIGRLVSPGGYLFVSGIDLDIRSKVARDLGWIPVPDFLEEIHDGDTSVRNDWPWKYWGLEPLNKRKRDWRVRYASAFQLDARIPG